MKILQMSNLRHLFKKNSGWEMQREKSDDKLYCQLYNKNIFDYADLINKANEQVLKKAF